MNEDMSSPLLRDDHHYVLLLPNLDEQFLTRHELQEFLQQLLQEYPHLQDADLARYGDLASQAERVIQTTCSLAISEGETVQWYAVRLHKPAPPPLPT
ncbi:MAG: chlororespiratory reduction protein 7 [Cyanobacteriota bacterium]|nr:chlororespiratory reduction protein 7 [Cyanobacteriota bacterium]